MLLLDVEGTAFERGVQQGAKSGPLLRGAYRALAELPLFPAWFPGPLRAPTCAAAAALLGRRYLWRHRGLLARRRNGHDLQLLRGLSRGARMPIHTLYGLHAFESESCNVGFRLGCTSLALDAESCHDGVPRLAYNHDFPAPFERYLMLRRNRPADGLRSLTLGYPALVGCICGVNEAGLAMSLNQAFACDGGAAPPATFVTMMVAECLTHCRTAAEATQLLCSVPVTNGAMVTLLDETGERRCVELSTTRHMQRSAPAGQPLCTFNRYATETMRAVELPVGALTTGIGGGYDVHAPNLARAARYAALEAATQRYDDAALFALLSDHGGGEGDGNTICSHGDALSQTIASVVLQPRSREMLVVQGKPCENAATRHAL